MKSRIYACQFDIAWESPAVNYRKVETLIKRAKPVPGSLIVLPELFAVGFSMNTSRVAESDDGPTCAFLRQLARQWRCSVMGGVPIRRGRRLLNEAVCFDARGRTLVRYAKTHTFNPGGEGRHYQRGSRLSVFAWRGLRVAPFVCYDLRFPQLFGAARQHGAELMIVIASWPAPRDAHWRALLQARAIENQAYVLGVNRTGSDPHSDYAGNTCLFDPFGTLVVSAGPGEGVLCGDVDAGQCREYRRKFPVFDDRRRSLQVTTPATAPRRRAR